MKSKNPWDLPGWGAISRESTLVKNLVGSGVTALGKASYADKLGEYYTAFFGLSVGLERLAKLILIVDYAISNGGTLPAQNITRRFGHKLADLLGSIEIIQKQHALKIPLKPTNSINVKIIECLDAFADAGRGRYANFAEIGNPSLSGGDEPIHKWWTDVGELILNTHYYGKAIQRRSEHEAQLANTILSQFSFALHFKETGEIMTDVQSAVLHTRITKIVQKYGRYYTLTLIRWLAEIFSELSKKASYEYNMHKFFGHHEHFYSYTVNDSFFKTRKIWPLRS